MMRSLSGRKSIRWNQGSRLRYQRDDALEESSLTESMERISIKSHSLIQSSMRDRHHERHVR